MARAESAAALHDASASMAETPPVGLQVEVVYCPSPGVADSVALCLPPGAVLGDALLASGLLQRHGLVLDGLRVGIWCRACEPTTPLRERDRVEIYRALTVDPKEARRLRYKRGRVLKPKA